MRRVLVLAPLVIVFAYAALWLPASTRATAKTLVTENKPVELLTFLALLVGGCVGLWLTRRLWVAKASWHVTGFYALFSLGLIFVALEEISWGQWIFEFDTPEALKWRNRQAEFNIHNVGWMHGKNSALRLLFGLGGLCGLSLRRWSLLSRLDPPGVLLSWFLVISACAVAEAALDLGYLSQLGPHLGELMRHDMPEVVEMLIGLAGALYILINRRRCTAAPVQDAPAAVG